MSPKESQPMAHSARSLARNPTETLSSIADQCIEHRLNHKEDHPVHFATLEKPFDNIKDLDPRTLGTLDIPAEGQKSLDAVDGNHNTPHDYQKIKRPWPQKQKGHYTGGRTSNAKQESEDLAGGPYHAVHSVRLGKRLLPAPNSALRDVKKIEK